MARAFDRFLASFTCQDSAVISADADSTGTKNAYDTSAGDLYMDGCGDAEVEIDVTAAPASAAYCEIWHEPLQHDGTGNAAPRLLGVLQIETTADKYTYQVSGLSEEGFVFIHAVDAGFTASASMRGIYTADL